MSPVPQKPAKQRRYYDRVFAHSKHYRQHYRKFSLWPVFQRIVQELRRIGDPMILELGCGTGQLAHYLHDEGFHDYHGIDFSPVAVKRARATSPQSFDVADIIKPSVLERPYDVVIATEVLEHLDDDLALIERVRPGSSIMFSVPTFDDPAHVRHFPTANDVTTRYEPLLDSLVVENVLENVFLGVGHRRVIQSL